MKRERYIVFSFTEVLKETGNLYRTYYKDIVGLLVILCVFSFSYENFLPKTFIENPFGIFLSFITTVLTILISFAQIVYIHNREQGNRISLVKSIRICLTRFIPVLATVFISSILIIGGLFLLIIPGIIFFSMFVQAYYFTLLENKNPKEALQESYSYSQGKRAKILLYIGGSTLFFGALSLKIATIGQQYIYFGMVLEIIEVMFVSLFSTVFDYVVYRCITQSKNE